MVKDDISKQLETPQGLITDSLSLSKIRSQVKKEKVKIIELDDKTIRFIEGEINIFGNVETKRDEIIIKRSWIDEYGTKWVIHPKDNIRSKVVLSPKEKQIFMSHFNELLVYEKENLVASLTLSEKQAFYKILSDDEKEEVSIIEGSLVIDIDTVKGLTSKELKHFGRIKILDELSQFNTAQFYAGLFVGLFLGCILTMLIQLVIVGM